MPAAGAGADVPTWVYAPASGMLAAGAVLVAGRARPPPGGLASCVTRRVRPVSGRRGHGR